MRWLVLLAFVPTAWAGTVGPWIGVKTYHLSRENPVNEQNQLVGVQYNRWFAARFENSFHEPSWAVGYALWQMERPVISRYPGWRYNLRLSPGIAYGYGDRLSLSVGGFTPGLIPSAGLKWKLSEEWQFGSDVLYIWTDDGGVLLQGLYLGWSW